MKKVILVDGNNLLFRSYYATAYTGNTMKNSKGFPTNALFGFVNMMNKIITEENPKYIMVAFDIGKTFRHEKYVDYKGGRNETPDDLKKQFPVAKEILTAMGITYLEKEGYEADDIIGTYSRMVDEYEDFEATIVSSDKDLLQLISDDVCVKLLKTKDSVRMTSDKFFEVYGIKPIRMVDLKSLMGDASDNIPGVKGVGEKTALKLLQQYETLDNLYEHIDEIKGALHNKLVEGKDSAYMSYDMATIYREVPDLCSLDDIVYKGSNYEELVRLYNELEFHVFLKNLSGGKKELAELEVEEVLELPKFTNNIGLWLELDNDNYHKANIISVTIYDGEKCYYIRGDRLDFSVFRDCNIYTYDAKKLKVILLSRNDFYDYKIVDDVMIMAYLLNYNVKDDIAYLAIDKGAFIAFNDKKVVLSESEFVVNCGKKAKFIYEVVSEFREELIKENINELYYDIEFPLAFVLADMEYNGIRCDVSVLKEMSNDIKNNLDVIVSEIYAIAGCEFNISSPKQLGDILFVQLKLPYAKKNKSGYVTDISVLSKLRGYPIVDKVLEYRTLSKLYNTYIEGLINNVLEDGKIHTIYTQTLTRTGRLSSIEPNLQNIPARSEYGRLIRKAFKPLDDCEIMSCDYSQIELRVFASLAGNQDLINAFREGVDIHTKTASDVFHVPISEVSKDQRRQAKAVNFGIIYGISSYGLSEDLGISPKEAKSFIDSYMSAYPGIREYMDSEIKRAYNDGYVKTIMNRKRIISELSNSNYNIRSMGERMALNTPIQGSSADILKKAMVDIDKEFKRLKLKSKMLLQVHDELIFNVYPFEKEIVSSVVVRLMEEAYELEVPLKVSLDFGGNWYEAK